LARIESLPPDPPHLPHGRLDGEGNWAASAEFSIWGTDAASRVFSAGIPSQITIDVTHRAGHLAERRTAD
jgi:inosine-uridine nucleoside N-ribohydrolase